VAELHLDFVAANALEIHGDRVSGRLLEPELDGPAKAAALRRFATQRRIPASQTVAVGRAADDPTALLEAGLAISLSRRTCTAADPGSQDTLDSVLFLLGIGADAVQR
jgi:phosphoserine phosphatase